MSTQKPSHTKLAIVGAGAVGSTLAYAALARGAARSIALLDVDAKRVQAEAIDLRQGLMFVPETKVEGSDDFEVCRDANVVVVTAGAKQLPGQSRLELAGATADIMKSLLPKLVEVAPDAIYLIVSNPVDVITYVAQEITGLPRERVFGSGTVLDTSRLRAAVAEFYGISVGSVHAYIAGEHGDSEIPLWSTANIAGVPFANWQARADRPQIGSGDLKRIADEVVNSAYTIIEGKGATNYAIGLAAVRIVEAVLRDEHRVLPVSSRLDDYFGISDVCLSVPSVVGAAGVLGTLDLPYSEGELAGLRESGNRIRAAIRGLGF